VLGELAPSQCRALAEETRDLDYPGVVGPDRTAQWFAQRAPPGRVLAPKVDAAGTNKSANVRLNET
jgi:hypothetical protein